MINVVYYDYEKQDWLDAEQDGEAINFASRRAAEEWLEENQEEACCRGSYKIEEYIACERCGEQVLLSGFTNTCDCGADYNSCGQLLAPREQWGWETGETAADILAVDLGVDDYE